VPIITFLSHRGTLAEDATFHQITATEWPVTSADGLIRETITLVGTTIDTTTDLIRFSQD